MSAYPQPDMRVEAIARGELCQCPSCIRARWGDRRDAAIMSNLTRKADKLPRAWEATRAKP